MHGSVRGIAEDADLARSIETMTRTVEESRQKVDASELTSSRLVHEIGKRLEDEIRAREADGTRSGFFSGWWSVGGGRSRGTQNRAKYDASFGKRIGRRKRQRVCVHLDPG